MSVGVVSSLLCVAFLLARSPRCWGCRVHIRCTTLIFLPSSSGCVLVLITECHLCALLEFLECLCSMWCVVTQRGHRCLNSTALLHVGSLRLLEYLLLHTSSLHDTHHAAWHMPFQQRPSH